MAGPGERCTDCGAEFEPFRIDSIEGSCGSVTVRVYPVWCYACPAGHRRRIWGNWYSELNRAIEHLLSKDVRHLAPDPRLSTELQRYELEIPTSRLSGRDAPSDLVTATLLVPVVQDPTGSWIPYMVVAQDVSNALEAACKSAGL